MIKSYLGDSVYATHEDGRVTLTTENGFGASNTIHLDGEVVWELLEFIGKSVGGKVKIIKEEVN